jgi:hypothetical protein
MAEKDRKRLTQAWELYQWRRRRADERQRRAHKRWVEENDRARAQLSKTILQLREEGYSLTDVGQELGMSRQSAYDLVRPRARPSI